MLQKQNLASKYDVANFVKKSHFDDKLKDLSRKITWNKTKHILFENEFKKLQTFDSSLFIVQSYFNNDGSQNYLIFQLLCYTLKRLGNTKKVVSWKSKGFSDEKPTTPASLSLSINRYENSKFYLMFKGTCLKPKKRNL